ncbi:MAG: heme-copper oxidase subunit III [Candidatus Rokubacteria bacterium]|nr:heme-copper oxidase subunit III [Candidatus Rokubacteria bacterium]
MLHGSVAFKDEVTDERGPGVGRVPPRRPPDSGDGGEPWLRGSPSQPPIDAARLGMLIFLGSETMLFAGFVAAFLVFRLGAAVWPPPFQPRLPVGVTGVNTWVLLLSGYTMWRALRAVRRGDQAGLARRLAQTGLLGVAFLTVQGYEWGRLLEFGLTASSGVYGGTFYTLIGAHAAHVLGALTWLSIILTGATRGRYTAEDHVGVSLCGMYWYFVVALWPILYTLVYLA